MVQPCQRVTPRCAAYDQNRMIQKAAENSKIWCPHQTNRQDSRFGRAKRARRASARDGASPLEPQSACSARLDIPGRCRLIFSNAALKSDDAFPGDSCGRTKLGSRRDPEFWCRVQASNPGPTNYKSGLEASCDGTFGQIPMEFARASST